MKDMERLPEITREMLGGLHADEALRQRILHRANTRTAFARGRFTPQRVLPMAVAVVLLAVGVFALRGTLFSKSDVEGGSIARMDTYAAGEIAETPLPLLARADVPEDSVSITTARSASPYKSLFAAGQNGNFPLVGYNGKAYRMLTTPSSLQGSALGDSLGTVAVYTEEPSLADGGQWRSILSNAAAEGAQVYKISGLSADTAIAAEVDGRIRVFQRYSYADYGASGSLEDVLGVRGKISSLDLSGVGEITDGTTANRLIALLLDNASRNGSGARSGSQALNIRLNSGITLQLSVSDSQFSACGVWSCSDFLDAYEAALAD